jgi:hypothetical protein
LEMALSHERPNVLNKPVLNRLSLSNTTPSEHPR